VLHAPARKGPVVSPPAHRTTTAHLGVLHPFLASPGLACERVVIGKDLLGGPFAYDPFELYERGTITNPNMIVLGQIGRGKSAFVKSYLFRQALSGAQAWVVDPKGEYAPLARAYGCEPLRLEPGGPLRLNPLQPLELGASERSDPEGPARLLAGLAEACLGRALLPEERAALAVALAEVAATRVPTLPGVVEALLSPSREAARALRTDARALAASVRDVALELRRLVHGDLRGMFDGPTSEGIDLAGRLVVLDLSALYGSPALGMLMACATACIEAVLRGGPGRRFVVLDEAWAVLANLGVARWLRASFKLARAFGVSNVAVLHRVSDLEAAGASGSETVALAKGLLADAETVVVFGQPPGEARRCQELLGLSDVEAGLLGHLTRGRALWRVGRGSFVVEHVLGGEERLLVDTDATMAAAASVR
jgi:hypothetical protein